MTGGRLGVLIAIAITGALAGCGAGAPSRSPDLHALALPKGVRITSQARQCDRGANAYCAIELVVVDPHAATSAALVVREHALLKSRGWSGATADNGNERAADSPGHKLRVTYATAASELGNIDLGFVKRSRATALALSRALFGRSSAMAVVLEVGAS
jgi:hypothetical protein